MALESEKIGLPGTTTTYRIENKNILESGNSSRSASPKKSDSHQNPNFLANMKACKSAGIGNPKAREISDQFDDEGVPIGPDYINGHVQAAGPLNIGLAIIRIQGNELIPAEPKTEESPVLKKINLLRKESGNDQ